MGGRDEGGPTEERDCETTGGLDTRCQSREGPARALSFFPCLSSSPSSHRIWLPLPVSVAFPPSCSLSLSLSPSPSLSRSLPRIPPPPDLNLWTRLRRHRQSCCIRRRCHPYSSFVPLVIFPHSNPRRTISSMTPHISPMMITSATRRRRRRSRGAALRARSARSTATTATTAIAATAIA